MTSVLKVDTIQNSSGTKTVDVAKYANIGKGFHAYPTAGQTFANNGNEKMLFANEEYDDFDAYDTSTSTFTVPVTGTYLLSVGYRVSNGTNNDRLEVGVFVGSSMVKTFGINQQNSNDASIASSIVVRLTQNDAVTLKLHQNSGSSLVSNTQSNIDSSPAAGAGFGHWSMTLLRES
jgi:hypothetical protein